MAKNEVKIKDFFEGKRRKCSLDNFQVLRAKNSKHTIKLAISMPLSNDSIAGIPTVFAEPFGIMAKDKSPHNLSKVSVIVESAEFSIFSTDVVKRAYANSNAASLQNFRLVGEGVDEKRTVSLEFDSYLPGTEPLRDWCWDHLHKDFFIEVVPAQMELEEQEDDKPKNKKNAKQMELVQ